MPPSLPPSARHRWIATRAIDTAWVGAIVTLGLAVVGLELAAAIAPMFACGLAAYGVYLYFPTHFVGEEYFEAGGMSASLLSHTTAGASAPAVALLVSTLDPTTQLIVMVSTLFVAGLVRINVDPLLEPHEHS